MICFENILMETQIYLESEPQKSLVRMEVPPTSPLPTGTVNISPKEARKHIREQISGAKGFSFTEESEMDNRSFSARRTRMQISQSGAKGFGFQN